MRRFIFILFWLIVSIPLFAQYQIRGGKGDPYLAEENKNARIVVYLLNGLTDAQISFTSENTATHYWYKYNANPNEGIAVDCSQSGNTSTITNIEDGWGYFVGDPAHPSTSYIWVIDYSRYLPLLSFMSVEEDEEEPCDYIRLMIDIEEEDIFYRNYNGARIIIPRSYELSYERLSWDESSKQFVSSFVTDILENTPTELLLDAPLKDTSFSLKGDLFSRHFGIEQELLTPVYQAKGLEVHAYAEDKKEFGETELSNAGDTFGDSAPYEMNFIAYANEPLAAMYIWRINKILPDGQKETIMRPTAKSFSYIFMDEGNYTVDLEVINATTTCFDTSQSFNVSIGSTEINVPNYFSPGSSGSLQEFKIQYKSLKSFKCTILNTWGNVLYQWTDPSKGWDGRVEGRYVASGAYYYIIEYETASGKRKTKSGDINILREVGR